MSDEDALKKVKIGVEEVEEQRLHWEDGRILEY